MRLKFFARTTVAALIAACALSACASGTSSGGGTTSTEDRGGGTQPESTTQETSMRTIAAGESVSIQRGETVRLPDGATLRFVTVTQDSRCPPGVQCIRAGDADIEFAFTPPGGTATTVTPNLPESPTATIGAWRLTVEKLGFGDTPAPVTVKIDAAP